MLILADFLLSFHHICTDHTIFYIEEKVSQQAAACSDLLLENLQLGIEKETYRAKKMGTLDSKV